MTKDDDFNNIVNSYLKDSEDFGFTTVNNEIEEKNLTIAELLDRLAKVEKIIMPLLVNLLKTADHPTIHWPNRRNELEAKIKDILNLTRNTNG